MQEVDLHAQTSNSLDEAANVGQGKPPVTGSSQYFFVLPWNLANYKPIELNQL